LARQWHAMPSRINSLRETISHSFLRRPIPAQALRVPGDWGSLNSTQSAHEGGKVVRPTHRPTLPNQDIFLVLVSLSGWVDRRVIALCQWKIPVATSGIETATFRLVAQCPNQLHHCLFPYDVISLIKTRRRKLTVLEAYGNQELTKNFIRKIWSEIDGIRNWELEFELNPSGSELGPVVCSCIQGMFRSHTTIKISKVTGWLRVLKNFVQWHKLIL
jgi:hypothetical protein